MKRNPLIMCFGLLIIMGVSCAPISTNTPSPSVTPEISSIWIITWLTQPACKPPCWQNITPGVTTTDEAVSILEKMPDTTITYNVPDGVEWHFGQTNHEGGWFASQDGIIRSIALGGDSAILLQTIIASYGNPTYVKTYDCRNYMCATFLIYPDLGMLVDVFVKNAGRDNENPQIEILPEIVSNRVFFIESGMENFKKITSFQDYGSPIDWKGYGEYP